MLRYVDFEQMKRWQRGNKLKEEKVLEYAVHGWWSKAPEDENGSGGCWWVTLQELLAEYDDEKEGLFVEAGSADILQALDDFEEDLGVAREEEVAAIKATWTTADDD